MHRKSHCNALHGVAQISNLSTLIFVQLFDVVGYRASVLIG